jgi:hypothetical protein
MIADRTRDADATWRAFCLQPYRNIHHVTMYVGAVRDDIADVDTDAKSDSSVGSCLAVKDWDLLLHSERTSHGTIDTVEHHEQRVAAGVDDPATIDIDRRVDDFAPKPAHPIKGSNIVQPDQAAVTDHISMNHDNQLAPIRGLAGLI